MKYVGRAVLLASLQSNTCASLIQTRGLATSPGNGNHEVAQNVPDLSNGAEEALANLSEIELTEQYISTSSAVPKSELPVSDSDTALHQWLKRPHNKDLHRRLLAIPTLQGPVQTSTPLNWNSDLPTGIPHDDVPFIAGGLGHVVIVPIGSMDDVPEEEIPSTFTILDEDPSALPDIVTMIEIPEPMINPENFSTTSVSDAIDDITGRMADDPNVAATIQASVSIKIGTDLLETVTSSSSNLIPSTAVAAGASISLQVLGASSSVTASASLPDKAALNTFIAIDSPVRVSGIGASLQASISIGLSQISSGITVASSAKSTGSKTTSPTRSTTTKSLMTSSVTTPSLSTSTTTKAISKITTTTSRSTTGRVTSTTQTRTTTRKTSTTRTTSTSRTTSKITMSSTHTTTTKSTPTVVLVSSVRFTSNRAVSTSTKPSTSSPKTTSSSRPTSSSVIPTTMPTSKSTGSTTKSTIIRTTTKSLLNPTTTTAKSDTSSTPHTHTLTTTTRKPTLSSPEASTMKTLSSLRTTPNISHSQSTTTSKNRFTTTQPTISVAIILTTPTVSVKLSAAASLSLAINNEILIAKRGRGRPTTVRETTTSRTSSLPSPNSSRLSMSTAKAIPRSSPRSTTTNHRSTTTRAANSVSIRTSRTSIKPMTTANTKSHGAVTTTAKKSTVQTTRKTSGSTLTAPTTIPSKISSTRTRKVTTTATTLKATSPHIPKTTTTIANVTARPQSTLRSTSLAVSIGATVEVSATTDRSKSTAVTSTDTSPLTSTNDMNMIDPTSSTTSTTMITSTATKSSSGGQVTQTIDVTSMTYIDAILVAHNVHRPNHSVSDLVWNQGLADIAMSIAQTCVYQHNTTAGGGGYGQNIGAGAKGNGAALLINNLMYNGEINNYPAYNDDNPDMTDFHSWGHYSQIVWGSTTSVGCATFDCSSHKGGLAKTGPGVAPFFTVCNYGPPGNYLGEFTQVHEPNGAATVVLVNRDEVAIKADAR